MFNVICVFKHPHYPSYTRRIETKVEYETTQISTIVQLALDQIYKSHSIQTGLKLEVFDGESSVYLTDSKLQGAFVLEANLKSINIQSQND